MSSKPSIVLNMIVRDESHNIEDCLASVLPLIDHWVIVDTGSVDDTCARISSFFKKHQVPGDLHHRDWVDFGHNRNEALALTRGAADYVLIMDADDRLHLEEDFVMPQLEAEAYGVLMRNGAAYYRNLRLVQSSAPMNWYGVVHEFLGSTGPQVTVSSFPDSAWMESRRAGLRSQDPNTYIRDAQLLEKELAREPDNARYWFYLGQSYRDAGLLKRAIDGYMKRLELGGDEEEVYCALLEMGRAQHQLGQPWAVTMHTYLSAYDFRPERSEAIYEVIRRSRGAGHFALGYALSLQPSQVRHCDDWLFVEREIYEWQLLDERARCAMGLGKWGEASAIYQQLLDEGIVAATEKDRVVDALERCLAEIHAQS